MRRPPITDPAPFPPKERPRKYPKEYRGKKQMLQKGLLFSIKEITAADGYDGYQSDITAFTFQPYDNALVDVTVQAKTLDGDLIWWKQEKLIIQCTDINGYLFTSYLLSEYQDSASWNYTYEFDGLNLIYHLTGIDTDPVTPVEWIIYGEGFYSYLVTETTDVPEVPDTPETP